MRSDLRVGDAFTVCVRFEFQSGLSAGIDFRQATISRLYHVSLCLFIVELDGTLSHRIIQSEVGARLTLRFRLEGHLREVV